MSSQRKTAIIVGASSGMGAALARILARAGYSLGLIARREELLRELQATLSTQSCIRALDVRDARTLLPGWADVVTTLGSVDLVIVCAGIGDLNPTLELQKELDVVATNVTGFTRVANLAFHQFLRQGRGHLVGLSSMAALRGSAHAPAYNASKAYVANYLEGLAVKAAASGLPIAITQVQPGFVATAMAKGDGLFWVTPVEKAADQIYRAIKARRAHVYVSRRWRLVAWLLKGLPASIYRRL